jgi:serine/threonine protein kinase
MWYIGRKKESRGATMTNSTEIEQPKPGETILNGQYTIEKYLGSGGQGQVYLARHRIFGQVAVKRLHPVIADQPERRARFERELRIAAQLHSEHVIFIRQFDEDPARNEWFSVMEYANGGSLEDKLDKEAPLSITEAIHLAIALCQALAHVHQYPYVHGDLKPSNILFHIRPNQELTLKLSDFGGAFQPVHAGVLPLPSGLKAPRTTLYVSPELLDASDPEDTEALPVDVDQRADIYSVGVILYEMLTGHPPFWEPSSESEDPMVHLEREHAILVRVKEQLPPEPKAKRREILPALNDLVMKTLSKDPADRFASVGEMQACLEETLEEEKARLAELERLRPLADQAFEEEKWGQASDILYKILNLDPDDQDAIEKRRIVEDQQRLGGLRLQIPRAMDDEQWVKAKILVEEALAIEPYDTILVAWQEEIDEQLSIIEMLEQAREAEKSENWLEACNLYGRLLTVDTSHSEALSLFNRARTQLRIATLRQEVQERRMLKDRHGELSKLKELLELVPNDTVIKARIVELQESIDLETYYNQGKQAYDEGRWAEAVEAFNRALAVDQNYRTGEAAALKADAERRRRLKQEGLESRRSLYRRDEASRRRTSLPLRRFTDIRYPEQCKIYQPVHLSIQLTLKPVQTEMDISSEVPSPLPPTEVTVEPTINEIQERQVELIVFVSADTFETDRRWRRLSMPFSRDSEMITFELIPQKLGLQIFEIEFFHGTSRVGYVVAETQVVDGDTSGHDDYVTYEPVDDRVWSGIEEQPTATVFVNWQGDRGIDYWILERNARIPDPGGYKRVTSVEEAVIGFWEDLSDLLGQAIQLQLSGLAEYELNSIWLHIRGLGRELGERVLSEELQSHSSTWPMDSVVVIATNELWIPWELIYDGSYFWGDKFILARIPKIPGQRAFWSADKVVERHVSTQLRKVVNIIGGKLGPSPIVERVRGLFNAFKASILIEAVERATLAEVFQAISQADLIHFTCHGTTTPRPCLQLADDKSLICCLMPSDLQNLVELTDSVVFANACTSAAIASFLGQLCNFGWEFYKKGVAAYIGTLGLVPTAYAITFAERFYERLLAGHTVGESLHYAKSGARRQNPFWLLYTLYGDPFARKSANTSVENLSKTDQCTD